MPSELFSSDCSETTAVGHNRNSQLDKAIDARRIQDSVRWNNTELTYIGTHAEVQWFVETFEHPLRKEMISLISRKRNTERSPFSLDYCPAEVFEPQIFKYTLLSEDDAKEIKLDFLSDIIRMSDNPLSLSEGDSRVLPVITDSKELTASIQGIFENFQQRVSPSYMTDTWLFPLGGTVKAEEGYIEVDWLYQVGDEVFAAELHQGYGEGLPDYPEIEGGEDSAGKIW